MTKQDKSLLEENKDLTICWSNTTNEQIKDLEPEATAINPIGEWTGGTHVDTGITGRKLASDFYGVLQPLGGGTMHGKDLSKADCSVNIYCFLKAQETGEAVELSCAIGDDEVITCRPADLIGPELKKYALEMREKGIGKCEEDVLSYALFPQVAEKFFAVRDKKELITSILEKNCSTEEKTNRLMAIDTEMRNAEVCDYTIKFENCEQAVAAIRNKLNI